MRVADKLMRAKHKDLAERIKGHVYAEVGPQYGEAKVTIEGDGGARITFKLTPTDVAAILNLKEE